MPPGRRTGPTARRSRRQRRWRSTPGRPPDRSPAPVRRGRARWPPPAIGRVHARPPPGRAAATPPRRSGAGPIPTAELQRSIEPSAGCGSLVGASSDLCSVSCVAARASGCSLTGRSSSSLSRISASSTAGRPVVGGATPWSSAALGRVVGPGHADSRGVAVPSSRRLAWSVPSEQVPSSWPASSASLVSSAWPASSSPPLPSSPQAPACRPSSWPQPSWAGFFVVVADFAAGALVVEVLRARAFFAGTGAATASSADTAASSAEVAASSAATAAAAATTVASVAAASAVCGPSRLLGQNGPELGHLPAQRLEILRPREADLRRRLVHLGVDHLDQELAVGSTRRDDLLGQVGDPLTCVSGDIVQARGREQALGRLGGLGPGGPGQPAHQVHVVLDLLSDHLAAFIRVAVDTQR